MSETESRLETLKHLASLSIFRGTFEYIWNNPGETKEEIIDANKELGSESSIAENLERMVKIKIVRSMPIRREFDIGLKEPGVDYYFRYFADLPASKEFYKNIMPYVKPDPAYIRRKVYR